ncbi:MAG TPA: hypothetical protein VJU87_10470 [Gemmatimonadaceae bacterium]|nr:hypothetical protein [Gemmatimonadaceae bacterium]
MPSPASMIRLCRSFTAMLLAAIWFPAAACAQSQGQHDPAAAPGGGMPMAAQDSMPMAGGAQMLGMADHAMGGMAMDPVMSAHMLLTPARAATHADTVRALAVVDELRRAIAKYRDTSAATAAGFRMFLPNVKHQRVYHFTNYHNAFREAFRFDPEQPTSLLYKPGTDGKLVLIGAMYTAPRGASLDRLNERVPLSIAHWHKHVNWCLPRKGENARWLERRDGRPVFGPESPIATKAACDAVGGDFHDTLFGWMVHANVFAGSDLASIFGEE